MKKPECVLCHKRAIVEVNYNEQRGLFGTWRWSDRALLCPFHATEWYQRQVIAYNAFVKVKV